MSLQEVTRGSELSTLQEGLPAAIPVEPCSLGRHDSLAPPAPLVEPNIPDGA